MEPSHVTKAEIIRCLKCVKQRLSFDSVCDISKFFQLMFPGTVVHKFSLGKTKCVYAINRVWKIRFSGARKSVLLKPSSGERCAPRNFVLLVTLQGTRVSLTCSPHLVPSRAPNEIGYKKDRLWSNEIIFCNFLMEGLKGFPRKGKPNFASHGNYI